MSTYLTANQIITALANTPQITFEVTDVCNLRCEYCAYGKLYSDYDKREGKMLSIETAKSFIDYMATVPLLSWMIGKNYFEKTGIIINNKDYAP